MPRFVAFFVLEGSAFRCFIYLSLSQTSHWDVCSVCSRLRSDAVFHRCVFTFDHSKIRICQNNTPVAVGSRSDKNDLYYLNLEVISPKVEVKISSTLISLNTWHQRLGHISEEIIQSLEATDRWAQVH